MQKAIGRGRKPNMAGRNKTIPGLGPIKPPPIIENKKEIARNRNILNRLHAFSELRKEAVEKFVGTAGIERVRELVRFCGYPKLGSFISTASPGKAGRLLSIASSDLLTRENIIRIIYIYPINAGRLLNETSPEEFSRFARELGALKVTSILSLRKEPKVTYKILKSMLRNKPGAQKR